MLDMNFINDQYNPVNPGYGGHAQEPGLMGIKITKLVIADTGTYGNQHRRPYSTTLDANSISVIQERLANTSRYAPSLMGGVASGFIQPTANTECALAIPGGWDRPRLRFMMEVEYNYNTGGHVTEILLGWTSHVGIDMAGNIDPQMEFFINSVIQTRNTVERTPTGNVNRVTVGETSHILVNPEWQGVYNPGHEQRIRPADMFAVMSRNRMNLGSDVLDTRSASTMQAMKSRRTNNNPANYMSSVMEGYKNAFGAAQTSTDYQNTMMTARGFTEEKPANDDKFLSALRQVRGMPFVSNNFVWADLVQIQGTVEHVTKVHLADPQQQAKMHHAGQTQDWGATDRLTQVASIISQSVPAIMLELGVTELALVATNMEGFGGQHQVTILKVLTFANLDIRPYLETLKIRIITEVMNDISYNGGVGYEIQMRVNVLGDTFLGIKLNGEYAEYMVPSFSDAMLTPVTTKNNQLVDGISHDFEHLMGTLIDTNIMNRGYVDDDEAKYGDNPSGRMQDAASIFSM